MIFFYTTIKLIKNYLLLVDSMLVRLIRFQFLNFEFLNFEFLNLVKAIRFCTHLNKVSHLIVPFQCKLHVIDRSVTFFVVSVRGIQMGFTCTMDERYTYCSSNYMFTV